MTQAGEDVRPRARRALARWRRDGVPPPGAALLLAAAVAVGAGLYGLAGLAGLASEDGSRSDDPAAVMVGSRTPSEAPRKLTRAPAGEVRLAHATLHDLARWCAASATPASQQRLTADARVLITFARRHPDARFRVDGEWGTALSLLLVTRHELAQCAPSAARLADRELPADVRRGLPPVGVPAPTRR